MWKELPDFGKHEYKKSILAFASLSEMFAQKTTDEETDIVPFVNSKFQETVFQRAFHAVAEDIGNTSYDASVQHNGKRYLVGIKTFGFASGDQKVAQFKAKHDEWSQIIDQMKMNANGVDSKEDIDKVNQNLYMELAKNIASIRNARIESSRANIRGFHVEAEDGFIYSVYHVLMPSSLLGKPKIYVGETSYDKIDIENIEIIGCTSKKNPTNFVFSDGNHSYKYTSADSQLYMNFKNKEIVCDEWDVRYAKDAYEIFNMISEWVYPEQVIRRVAEDSNSYKAVSRKEISKKEPEETFCWTIWNKEGETELYSGFNSFYGTGSKMGREQREKRIEKLYNDYAECVEQGVLEEVRNGVSSFLLQPAGKAEERAEKARLREYLIRLAKKADNTELEQELKKILYRPMDEMYIPIPDSAQFHKEHPDFFGKGIGQLEPGSSKLLLPKEQRQFSLVFEPSGDSLPVYVTQDNGKAIESAEKQTYLGEWILRGIFQLGEYEPLTSQKLQELQINGLRFSKYKDSKDIHMEFIWIDENNPPKGFIART